MKIFDEQIVHFLSDFGEEKHSKTHISCRLTLYQFTLIVGLSDNCIPFSELKNYMIKNLRYCQQGLMRLRIPQKTFFGQFSPAKIIKPYACWGVHSMKIVQG